MRHDVYAEIEAAFGPCACDMVTGKICPGCRYANHLEARGESWESGPEPEGATA